VIHALPVAAAIKDAMPGCELDWVVAAPYREIVGNSRHVDRAIVFDRGMFKKPGGVRRLTSLIGELRRRKYDLVIDLQGLLRSGLMTLAARGKVKTGFANAREGAALFYGHRVAVPDTDMHAVDRYMLVLKSLGIPADEPRFDLDIPQRNRDSAEALLGECGIGRGVRYAAMAPSARWDTKRWDAENFAGLAGRLYKEKGIHTVMLGTEADGRLFDGPDLRLPEGVHTLFGRTGLMELAAILSGAVVAVTNDSGPMHIAAAVGTPTISVFGPTSHERTGPYGEGHRVIRSEDDCAPCFKRECDTVKCLRNIGVDTVFAETINALKEG